MSGKKKMFSTDPQNFNLEDFANDPELVAELESLGMDPKEKKSSKSKAISKKNSASAIETIIEPEPIKIEKIDLSSMEVDESVITLDDDDLNDPNLDAELNALGGGNDSKDNLYESTSSNPEFNDQDKVKVIARQLLKDGRKDEAMVWMNRLNFLEIEAKTNAISNKPIKSEIVQPINKADIPIPDPIPSSSPSSNTIVVEKIDFSSFEVDESTITLDDELDDFDAELNDLGGGDNNNNQIETKNIPNKSIIVSESSSKQHNIKSSATVVTSSSTTDITKHPAYNNREMAKANAQKYLKQGNKADAEIWMKRTLYLDELSKKDKNNGTNGEKVILKSISSSESGPIKDSFSLLYNALVDAGNTARKESKKCADEAIRASSVESKKRLQSQALEMGKKYKKYANELKVLESRRAIPGARPALFNWKQEKTSVLVQNLEIGDSQIILIVERVTNIDSVVGKYNGNKVSLKYDLGIPKIDPISGTITGIIKNGEIIFDDKSMMELNITRNYKKQSKVINTLFTKTKAKFSLTMHRMFFQSSIPLGQAELQLMPLLQNCEVGGDLLLTSIDNNSGKKKSKAVPGSLTLYLKLRTPIEKPEYKTESDYNLVIEAWPEIEDNSSRLSTSDSDTSFNNVIQSDSNSNLNEKEKIINKVDKNEDLVKASPTSPVKSGNNVSSKYSLLSDKEKKDPLSVEFSVSNDVLESELEALKLIIVTNKVDEGEMFITKMRFGLISTKLQTLEHNVKTNELSLENYVIMLKDRITHDKLLAPYIMSLCHQQKDEDMKKKYKQDAITVLKRVKIMEKEVSEAESGINEEV
jgi:hypothetical protein